MTFATPTSVAGYLSQKRYHVTKSTIISMSLPMSGDISLGPTIEGMRSCDATRQSPCFIRSCFFFHVSRELHTSDASRFFLANIDLTRSDWIWLTIDSQKIILIQRLLFSWKSWYEFVHFGSLVHYEFTRSTYGIYRDPSDTKHDVSQTVKQKSVLMNTSEILTNKDIQWQYPKTFEPSVVVDETIQWKLARIVLHPEGLGDMSFWPLLLVLPSACMKRMWSTSDKASMLQFDDTFAPATFGAAEHAVTRDVGFGGCKDSAAMIRCTIKNDSCSSEMTSVEIGF